MIIDKVLILTFQEYQLEHSPGAILSEPALREFLAIHLGRPATDEEAYQMAEAYLHSPEGVEHIDKVLKELHNAQR